MADLNQSMLTALVSAIKTEYPDTVGDEVHIVASNGDLGVDIDQTVVVA